MTPRARTAALTALAAVLLVAFAAYHFIRLTAPQQPRTFYDTDIYFAAAARPLSPALLVAAKPPTLPLVYAAADCDPSAIDSLQRGACFAAWLLLSASLVYALRRTAARAAAALAMLAMLLAPARVGFTANILSESLDDSLVACGLALALLLATLPPARRILRTAALAALTALAVAWVFLRDINALAALTAVAAALALTWPQRRTLRGAYIAAGIVALAAVIDLASTRVVPAEPLPYQARWAPALTARTGIPMIDNLEVRIIPDDDARADFAERGLPVDAVVPFTRPPRNGDFAVADPARADAQAWIADHASGAYLWWLARHPLTRIGELAGARTTLLAPDVRRNMPLGWIADDDDHVVLQWLRRAPGNRWCVLVLCLVAPFALRRRWWRRDPRAGLALCLLAAGVVDALASYYGDALELGRHAYGGAQLIELALILALVGALDRILAARADKAAA